MKITTEFGSKKLAVKYLIDGDSEPLTFVLPDIDQNATMDSLAQVVDGVKSLINGTLQHVYITEVAIGNIE